MRLDNRTVLPFAVVVVFLTSLLLSSPFRLEQCCRCDDHRRQEDDGSSSNGASPLLLVGDMPKSPSSQYGLKAQEDIDPRGIMVTNGL